MQALFFPRLLYTELGLHIIGVSALQIPNQKSQHDWNFSGEPPEACAFRQR